MHHADHGRSSTLLQAGLVAALLAGGLGCKGRSPPPREPLPKPVSIVELKKHDPTLPLRLSGSIKSWNEEDIAFEVSGRLELMSEQGMQLQGRTVEDGKVLSEGDVLAKIDDQQYKLQRDTATAILATTKQQLNATRIVLDSVLPAERDAAKAEKERADFEYDRIAKLFDEDVAPPVELAEAKKQRDVANAKVVRIEAEITAKQADVAALEAEVVMREEELREAQLDLERCTLRAPFDGEVAEVFTVAGGYANKGARVARLVMMDPVKIEVAVSGETARSIAEGEPIIVYPRGAPQTIRGHVHQKGTVADPLTRTFKITIVTRNVKLPIGIRWDSPLMQMPRIHDVMPLVRKEIKDVEGPLYAEDRCITEENGKHYVWKVADWNQGRPLTSDRPVFTLQKVPVVTGDRRLIFKGIYRFRELTDAGGLEPHIPIGQWADRGAMLAMNVPDGVNDGDQVALVPERWLLQPGDFAPVLLRSDAPGERFFVPMSAVEPEAGSQRDTAFASLLKPSYPAADQQGEN